jgi:hypothetical protein
LEYCGQSKGKTVANQPIGNVDAVNRTDCKGLPVLIEADRPILQANAVAEARRSVEWVIDDGNRASDVIRHVRSFANKTGVERLPLDVNDVAGEVIALVQRELTRCRCEWSWRLPRWCARISGHSSQPLSSHPSRTPP